MIDILGEYTIVELVEEQAVSAGGIVLSEAPKGMLPKGKVIAGKGCVGGTVLLMHPGNKALLGDKEVNVVKNEFVVGVLDD